MTELKTVIHQTTLTMLPLISGLLIGFARETEPYKMLLFVVSMICLFGQVILVMRLKL